MKKVILSLLALSSLTASAQFGAPRGNQKVASVVAGVEDFKPASTNQDNKQYPMVNSEGYVRFRVVAPEAQSVVVSLGLGGRGGTKLQKGSEHPYPRHYGQLINELFEKLKTMPEGEERDELVRLTANQMKRDLMTWGHGSMDDEKVADDLARYTDGVIQIDLNAFRFDRMDASFMGDSKRKRKK